jgi:hypothetical protein
MVPKQVDNVTGASEVFVSFVAVITCCQVAQCCKRTTKPSRSTLMLDKTD